MTQWQPIETAPKDGTDILVFCSTINQKEMAVVWFDPFAGWINFREDSYAPCSWMPLPPPPQSPSSTPITNEGKERKGIEMKDIHKLKRQLDLFYQLERIENFCKTLEEGRVWVKAEEGEDIGYSNLIAYIEAIHFRTGFMGYGTFKLVDFQFPDSELLELNETILDGLLAAADKRIIKIKQKISELSDEGEKS